MKRILLAFACLVGSIASAAAACSPPAVMHDFPGSSFNMSMVTNPADGNCASVVASQLSTGTTTLTGWTSATGLNTTQSIMASGQGAPAVLVTLDQTTTLTGGAVTFEGTYDGTFTDGPAAGGFPIPVAQVLNANTFAPLTNPYTLVASTNQPFLILNNGYRATRIRLSTVITGTATVTPFVTLLPYNPTIGALLSPLAAGSSIIGKVGIDQTTPGVTNAVNVPLTTASGWSKKRLSALTNSAVAIKSSAAGQLGMFLCSNSGASTAFVQVFDVATAGGVTLGTTVPDLAFEIPPGTSSGYSLPVLGMQFANGIQTAATTTATGSTAPGTLLNCNAGFN